jgi:uncharacterized protein YndB with AHSA1/START domain
MLRIDSATRLIAAPQDRIYEALINPSLLCKWLAPSGMRLTVEHFDPKIGGIYRMVLTYCGGNHTPGKSSNDTDVVEGLFVELVPNRRVVQAARFASSDTTYQGEMRITWSMEPANGGSLVTVSCEDVPPGISESDHLRGLNASLDNLSALFA